MHKGNIPYSNDCYVCGCKNPIGLKIKFKFEGKKTIAEFTPGIEHQGYPGVLHGGIISALLDETMGWAPTLITRRMCMTAELNVRYLKPTPIDRKLIVTGEATDIHKRLYKTMGEIRDEQGHLFVTATAKYSPLSENDTNVVDNYMVYDEDTFRIFKEPAFKEEETVTT
jgi:uncharacterized protein (TIGR00369 family)